MIDWEKLNAYADRELDDAAAAEVAAAAARNPAVAARVASLARLKAAMPQAANGLGAAPPWPARFPAPRAGRRFPVALAASLAAGAVGLALVLHGQQPVPAHPRAGTLVEARQWLSGPLPQDAAGGIAVASGNGTRRRLPDLSPAGLRLAWLQGGAGGEMIAGYVGPHGCRLGLWIRSTPARALAEATTGLEVSAWATSRDNYVLLSQGMDPVRFRRYAGAIAALTRQEGAPQDSLRIALEDAATVGHPCEG